MGRIESVFNALGQVARRLRLLTRLGDHERAMDEEMRLHLEMEAAELERGGLAPAAAMRRAKLTFGGIERFKEEGRDARGTRWVEDVWQDAKYGIRQLRANPGFSLATILTLALGIGASTAMHAYSRYDTADEAALVDAERLVSISQGAPGCTECEGVSAVGYEAIGHGALSFENVSLFQEWEPVFRGADRAELLNAARVTPEFFETLRLAPILGRTLLPTDADPAAERVVILGEAHWRTHFSGDPGVLGRTIVLDRIPYAIVGVAPIRSAYPRDIAFWTPLVLTAQELADPTASSYSALARLRNEVTVAAATSEVRTIAANLADGFPEFGELTFSVAPVVRRSELYGDPVMWAYTGGGAIVLLIAWVNLAGLLISRLVARRRELAVRRAIGAGAGRVVRQLLTEVVLVTTIGGALGALLAVFGVRALTGAADVPLDGYALATAVGIGVLSGAAIASLPALRFTRPRLATELCGSAKSTGSIDRARGRRALVVVQVALTIVLLVAAGVLARSFRNIYDVDPGFTADRVLALRLWAPSASGAESGALFAEVVRAVEGLPGVESVGAALGLPFGHGAGDGRVRIESAGAAADDQEVTVRSQAATPGFFATLGIPLLRGRTFSSSDVADSPPVAIVNEAFVDRHLGGSSGLGRSVLIDGERLEIVGVTRTVFYGDVEEIDAPEVYRPLSQSGRSNVWLVVRSAGNTGQLENTVADLVRGIDADIVISRVETFAGLRSADMGSERRGLRIMGGFAIAALMIAVIGLFGLVSYSVAQRTREFGIRLALGARASRVMGVVLVEGLRLAAGGAVLGVVGAVGALQVLRSMLFGVSPADPLTIGAVVVGIGATALLAAFIPAQRAMRADPIQALREE